MLSDGSLSDGVLSGMKQLTLHLESKQYQKAWDIHVSLMCDYVSEVSNCLESETAWGRSKKRKGG